MTGDEPAFVEAGRGLDHQIRSIESQSTEALEVTKINLLIFSILLGVFKLSDTMMNLYFYMAGVPLVLGVLLSIIAYGVSNPTIGLSKEGVIDLLEEEKATKEILPRVYAAWIEENSRKSTRVHRMIWLSLICTAISLGAFTAIWMFIVW